jgi:hypothetical protein
MDGRLTGLNFGWMDGKGIILTVIDATIARDYYDREHRNDKRRCTLITAISYRAIEKTKK